MFAFPGEKGECFILRIVVDLSGYTLIHCTLIFEMSVLPASNISSKMVQRCRGLTSALRFLLRAITTTSTSNHCYLLIINSFKGTDNALQLCRSLSPHYQSINSIFTLWI